MPLRVGLLGQLTLTVDGRAVTGLAPRQRAVLARLALVPGEAVAVDRLLHDVWGDAPPATRAKAVAFQVNRLRGLLEPERDGPGRFLRTVDGGYLLDVDPEAVDVSRFERLVTDAAGVVGDDPAKARDLLADAAAAWRGPPLADVPPNAHVDDAVRRLEELHLLGRRTAAEARLALGENEVLVPGLRDDVAAHPFDAGLVACLATALHRAGRTAAALDVLTDHRDRMADELGLDPPARLVELQGAILRDDMPGAGQGPAGNLPTRVTEVVGRDGQAVALAGDLLDRTRLLTLTGPGGVGKTTLAEHVGARATDDVRDGVWLVGLATVPPGGDVVAQVAADLRLRAGEGRDLAAVVQDHLAPRELVLVLDNCEHVLEAVRGLVVRWLGAAPGLRVVATSRVALGIPGEVVYEVAPLGADAAARLFRARAAEVASMSSAEDAEVARICARVGGLPLGIELAAARTRLLAPAELAARLDTSLAALGSAAGRQASLTGAVQWSMDLLDDEARTLLTRLAVFVDGADLAMAEAMGAGLDDPVTALDRLVGASLLRSGTDPLGATRVTMLEPVREVALALLVDRGAHTAARARHAELMAGLVAEAEPHLRGSEQLRWGRRLDLERGNVHAAMGALLDAGRVDDLLDCCWHLCWYWEHDGWFDDGLAALRTALAAPDAGDGADPYRVARGWFEAALLASDCSLPETVDLATRGIEVATRIDAPRLLGALHLFRGRGTVLRMEGDGREDVERGFELLGPADGPSLWDEPFDEAIVALWQGLFRSWGPPADRRAAFETAAGRFAALGDRTLTSAAQLLASEVFTGGADPDVDAWVARSLDDAVATARAHGYRQQRSHALFLRALVGAARGEGYGDPEDLVEASRLLESIGDQGCWVSATAAAAGSLVDDGAVARARDLLAPVVRVARGTELPGRRVRVLAVAAQAAALGGADDMAGRLVVAARRAPVPDGVHLGDVEARLESVEAAVDVPPGDEVPADPVICDEFLRWVEATAVTTG